MNQEHIVNIVEVNMSPHGNADSLSIVKLGGYTVVVKTESWENIKLGAYIPPDNIVDVSLPEFSFLSSKSKDGYARIKVQKLRGVVSYGLLVPAPEGTKVGDDVTSLLKVKPYIQNEGNHSNGIYLGGESCSGPNLYYYKYDLDSLRKTPLSFNSGEKVLLTEKIHGSFSRFVFYNDEMFVGSRNEWKREFPTPPSYEKMISSGCEPEKAKSVIESFKPKRSTWYKLIDNVPQIEIFCRKNPGIFLCGELTGQNFSYGLKKGEVTFLGFDFYEKDEFLPPLEAIDLAKKYNIPWVPVVGMIDYSFEECERLCQGQSLLDNSHIREGIVVERVNGTRNKMKLVNPTYLEKY